MENKKEKIDFIKNEPENLDDYFTDFYEEDIELLILKLHYIFKNAYCSQDLEF
mgnify:CR=1 FL=1